MRHLIPKYLTRLCATICVMLIAGCGEDTETLIDTRSDDELPTAHYTSETPSPGGTGKIYFGREISQVMGHAGVTWLERGSRIEEERIDLLIERLPITPGSFIADIGSGSGVLTIPMAKRAQQGRIYAVDIEAEMLSRLGQRLIEEDVNNVALVHGEIDDPKLPKERLDFVLIVDAYHEFSHPFEMMRGVVEALKPGGQVILVEYRARDPRVPIHALHTMTDGQMKLEMEAVGLSWVRTERFLPRQHYAVFTKQ